MTNSSQGSLEELLTNIGMNCNPPLADERCHRFSMDCLSLIGDKLPPAATEALGILEEYRAGRLQRQSILDAIVKLWRYLEDSYPGEDCNVLRSEVAVIRAVMLPLYAHKHPGEGDVLEHLGFFLELLNNVEPHYEEEEMLLRKHFPGCLDAAWRARAR